MLYRYEIILEIFKHYTNFVYVLRYLITSHTGIEMRDTRYILIMTTSCTIILNDNLAKLDFSSCATWKNVMLTLYGKINIIISVSYYFKYALVYNMDSKGSTPSSEEKDR